jgi:hypothetical protein
MYKKLSEISPHQFLTRRRLQIFDDEARERRLLDAVEKEDKWVRKFIGRLATAIQEIGSKSIGSSADPRHFGDDNQKCRRQKL